MVCGGGHFPKGEKGMKGTEGVDLPSTPSAYSAKGEGLNRHCREPGETTSYLGD